MQRSHARDAISLLTSWLGSYAEILTREYLNACLDQGLNVPAIAARVGCSVTTVDVALNRHGITRRGDHPLLDDPAFLADRINAGYTTARIAAGLGVTPFNVAAAWRRHASTIQRRANQL